MATYSRRVLHIDRVEFHVPAEAPWGATWAEVSKAMTAAANELREAKGREPSDDEISVAPYNEDGIVVSYELRTATAVDS